MYDVEINMFQKRNSMYVVAVVLSPFGIRPIAVSLKARK